jgi:hypothetical protein
LTENLCIGDGSIDVAPVGRTVCRVMGANGFVGFVPWVIFWVVSSPSTWGYAAGGALVAALILLIPSTDRGNVKTPDVVSVLFFGALTVAALFLDRSQLRWLENHAQASPAARWRSPCSARWHSSRSPSRTRASPPPRRCGRPRCSSGSIAC